MHSIKRRQRISPEKKGSTARSKLVAYSKLVRRVKESQTVTGRALDQGVMDRRRKYCEEAYKRQLTATVGNRKAARKAYVKAGREFDLILRGPV